MDTGEIPGFLEHTLGRQQRASKRNARYLQPAKRGGCACRRSNPGILVMQSAQGWATKNVPGAIDGARNRCIFFQGRMRAGLCVPKTLSECEAALESPKLAG